MKQRIQNHKKEIYNLAKSFSYAFKGLKFAIDNERNMRIHLIASLFVVQFGFLYDLKTYQWIYISIVIGLVITAELVNTAIEALVNMQTQSYTPLAKIAKDVAAGAVVVMALVAIIVALITFNDINKIKDIVYFIFSNIICLSIFIIELVLSVFFIFSWNKRALWK